MIKFDRIRGMREDHDLTQEKVAKLLNVKRSTYAMWELGDINFPIEKIVFLANYYQVNIDYLLNLSNQKKYIPHPRSLTLKQLGQNLKYFRLGRHLTQKQVATAIGVNQPAYAYYEYGYTRITTERLFLLSRTFNVSLDDICHK